MPELPEVTTTAKKLDEILPGLIIKSIWSNYRSSYFLGKENIKDPNYFKKFERAVVGKKIVSIRRFGKNVLINISGSKTILVHMKMTGHLLYGNYQKTKIVEVVNGRKKEVDGWIAIEKGPLQDKFNQYIRLVFELSNKKHLVLSDVRRFAKVCLIEDADVSKHRDLKNLGPDPVDPNFDFQTFKKILLKKPRGRIKNILMDQNLIAGVGNIYSDEALWLVGIHPEEKPINLSDLEFKRLLKKLKDILKKGIDFGGDSTSDYRQPDGRPGNFQKHHKVYRRKGQKCLRKGCVGKIVRKVVGGRSAHFCDIHQKLK